MLAKPATMLLGLIYSEPLNAYEIIKKLQYMRVKDWYEIADSTVYATIKSLEKKSLIVGKTQKDGNMPDKTVYTLTDTGLLELKKTLKTYIENFEYDLVPYLIAVFFIRVFDRQEAISILSNRLRYLKKANTEILKQIETIKVQNLPDYVTVNVKHNSLVMETEIASVDDLISSIEASTDW